MSVAMTGVPASSAARASLAAATTGRRSFLPLASFSSRGMAFSTVWRSARISSVWIVEMSEPGSTLPSTWVTSSSRKTRVTWQMAADSRMWERNLLPSPSPWEAPATMPAMSTNSTVAGRTRALPKTSARRGSRSSGTPTTPTLGSIVAKG
jgi:hypothetical protein